jgi:hypothetical protein
MAERAYRKPSHSTSDPHNRPTAQGQIQRRLYRRRPPYSAEWTFQFRTVPFSSLRCRRTRALKKIHQDRRRVGRGAYRVVWQNEFAKLSAEKRPFRPDRGGSKILRWRVGVGIKRRVVDWAPARPESSARNLVGIGLPHDSIGQVRYPARMPGSATSREARHGEIKASPEEMHRAHYRRLRKPRPCKIKRLSRSDAPKIVKIASSW